MKRTLFILLSLLTSTLVQAEWVELGRTDTFRVYVENRSLQRKGDSATVVQMLDFTTAQWADARTAIGSIKQLNEFDCVQPRFRTLSAVAYSEQMTAGKVVADETVADPQWEAVQPSSGAEQVRKLACGKK